MKVALFQPPYSTDYSKSDEYFQYYADALDNLQEGLDLFVMPESCDIPCLAKGPELTYASIRKYSDRLLQKASAAAKRCQTNIFINLHYMMPSGKARNSTCVFNRQGEMVGRYDKQHLVPNESDPKHYDLDSDYSFEYSEPYILELEGLRFAFLTCYDFYFYEAFPTIARQNVDFIIGCSHQRSDTHSALEIITQFLAYHTNAHVLRSSVSMGEDSLLGGSTMAVAPNGEVLGNLKSKVGTLYLDIDPQNKYFKPAGYGNPPAAHWQYIEQGRRPYKYRPAGSMMVQEDARMGYPRVCAHRGFNSVAPENSLPAYGAAVALGAEEIEFDLWATKDGVLVSLHDPTLDRVSNGTGNVWDYTYEELLKFDFGEKQRGEKFKDLKIPTFEEILKKFACTTIMNIHVKIWDVAADDLMIEKIVGLIRKYDCEKYVYFMSGNDEALKKVKAYAPNLRVCVGAGKDAWGIVDRAIAIGAEKVQLFRPYFNQEMVDKAHAHGIKCNVFWSDEIEKTKEYLDMGIDCILTNDYLQISNFVKEYLQGQKR